MEGRASSTAPGVIIAGSVAEEICLGFGSACLMSQRDQ